MNEWTTTPPTEPGWYWMTGTTAGENGEKLAVVKVVTVGPRRVLHVQLDQYLARLADLIELKLVSHWLKLEAPELPKETPS